AQRLLDGDFVEGIHRHLDVGEFDARSIAFDADLDVVVDDPLYRHKNLHRSFFRSNLKGNGCSGAEPRAPVRPGQRVKGQKLAPKASPEGYSLAVLAGPPEHVTGAIMIGRAGRHKQEVRQAVHILYGSLADGLVRPGREFHDNPFRPSANGAPDMQIGG